MFYTIYKITNQINGKIYIGKHQTKNLDDGYMGSGKQLNRAIQKYGLENFTKEILHIFDNEDDMNAKEKELVTEEFVQEETNYNLCPGGQGGWGYVNANGLVDHSKAGRIGGKVYIENLRKNGTFDEIILNRMKAARSKCKEIIKENGGIFWDPGFLGKTHSEEWRKTHSEFMKKIQSGSKNSQYGTTWITNGNRNLKIKKGDPIPEGFRYGRIFPPNLSMSINLCKACKDIEYIKFAEYWLNEHKKSELSIRQFVKNNEVPLKTHVDFIHMRKKYYELIERN